MLKLIGAAAVLAGCFGIGFYKAMRLKRRCDSLEKLTLCAEHIGAEIAFSKKRIERIFAETGRKFGLEVFVCAAMRIQSEGVKGAWKSSLADYAGDMALCESDISAAELLGSGAGDFAGEEQQKGIRTAQRLLELALGAAREDYARTAKLYRSGGALCGMLAVILLL